MRFLQIALADGRSVRRLAASTAGSLAGLSPEVRGLHADIIRIPGKLAEAYQTLSARKERWGSQWQRVERALSLAYGLAKSMEFGLVHRSAPIPMEQLERLKSKAAVRTMRDGYELQHNVERIARDLSFLADRVLSESEGYHLDDFLAEDALAEGIGFVAWYYGAGRSENETEALASTGHNVDQLIGHMEQRVFPDMSRWRERAYGFLAYLHHPIDDFIVWRQQEEAKKPVSSSFSSTLMKTAAIHPIEVGEMLAVIEGVLSKAGGLIPKGSADEAYLGNVKNKLGSVKNLLMSVHEPPVRTEESIA